MWIRRRVQKIDSHNFMMVKQGRIERDREATQHEQQRKAKHA